MDNNCYVYEWIRLDTNEPFYVGKGSNDRCYQLTRYKNNHFNNIVKSIPTVVNILHDNLDEQTAFGLEVWYIREYRDIIGYESMCNMNDGGEGQTLCGENNGMYGKGYLISGENHADFKGKNHPYSKSVIAIINDKIFGAFDYVTQGAEYFGCNIGNISKCCKGKRKSCGKYNGCKIIWKYIEIIEL